MSSRGIGGEGEPAALAASILGLTLVWTLLVGGALLAVPAVLIFATCAAGALAFGPRFRSGDLARSGRGCVAGVAAFGATICALDAACRLAGIDTQVLAFEHPSSADALAIVALAPVFEEIVYRGSLLALLRARVGSVAAVVLTSAAYALPHGSPAHIVSCFLLGLALATSRLCGLSLASSIGFHAGLNAAGLASTASPELATFVRMPILLLAGLAFAYWLLARR